MLKAWIETDGAGRITDAGYAPDSGGRIGATTVAVGPVRRTFQAVTFPEIRNGAGARRRPGQFTQTCGGKTGVPGAAAGRAPAVRAVAGADRVVDAER